MSLKKNYNKPVIVRCRNAGVHFGILKFVGNTTVTLAKSRRMWRWFSEFSLSEASLSGIVHEKSRIAAEVPEIFLFTADVCEIIPVSAIAAASIAGAPNAKP